MLAVAAGFTIAQANKIAANTQASDDDPNKSPAQLKDLIPWGNPVEKRRLWHFTTYERRVEMWQTFGASASDSTNSEDDDFMRLGEYLHALQDSYSHAGWGPRTGQVGSMFYNEHGDIELKSPARIDETDYNPSKVERMAKNTFDQLLKAREKMKTKEKRRPVPYTLIESFVKDFAKEKDRKQKNDILRRMSLVIVDYVALTTSRRGLGCFGEEGKRYDEFGR